MKILLLNKYQHKLVSNVLINYYKQLHKHIYDNEYYILEEMDDLQELHKLIDKLKNE